LVKWAQGDGSVFADEAGENNVRLSLAGAQDKISVRMQNSEIQLGEGNAPSTHILKVPSDRFKHLPENEVFTTMLANSVGLPVVKAGLLSVQLTQNKKSRIAVIERYDRYWEETNLLRLHQEDFCQALGFGPHKKYEEDGGPSLSDCAELIRQNSTVPAIELEKFLRWVVFNWLCHNADGHAKNISFLFSKGGKTEIAPFYDLVCTGNYTRQQVARRLAMQIGGESSPGAIGVKNLEQFSSDTGLPFKIVKENAIEVASLLLENLAQQIQEFESSFGTSPILQRIPRIAQRRCERALKFLKK
jgi:serine/threonine-protein kinase HipA